MATSRNLSPSNLAYPNISFTETIAGPLPINMGYRNTIGVVGSFNRGPEGPTLIRNRTEAFYLFGEDDSPGSLFLQQAMYEGATRFIISRVIPEAKPGYATVFMKPESDALHRDALVANSLTHRTVGLSFEADYVTPPIVRLGEFDTEPIEVSQDSQVDINLEGSAVLQFEVEELLEGQGRWADTLSIPPKTAKSSIIGEFLHSVSDAGTYQVVSFTEDSLDAVKALAKPGRLMVLQPTAASVVKQRAYSAPSVITDCINVVEGKLLFNSTPGFVSGQVVYVSTSGANLPAPLSNLTPYWVRVFPDNSVTLHTSYDGATGPVITLDKVVLTDVGTIDADLTLTPNVVRLTLGTGTVSLTNDTITLKNAANNELEWPFATGDEVKLTATGTNAALPGGVTAGTSYYVRKTNTTIKLFNTRANALGTGNTGLIDLATAEGTGTLNVALQNPVLSVDSNSGQLEVVSYVFFEDGYPSVLVRGNTEIHSGNFAIRFKEPTTSNNLPYYTFRIALVLTESIQPGDVYPAAMGTNGEFVNVLRLGRRDRNWQSIKVYTPVYKQDDPNVLIPRLRQLKETGVKLRFGEQSASDNLDFIHGSRFGVGLVRSKFTLGQYVNPGEEHTTAVDPIRAFPPGLPAAEILIALERAIRGDSSLQDFIGDVILETVSRPYSISLKTEFAGVTANRARCRFQRHWIAPNSAAGDPRDIILGSNPSLLGGDMDGVYKRFIGGADPMQYASRVLYDTNGRALVLVRALSPGRFGNNIRISIRPVPPGQWRLEVYDDTNSSNTVPMPAESFVMSNYSVDPQTGEFKETVDSRMVRCYFIPHLLAEGMPIQKAMYDLTPQRLAPPIEDVVEVDDPKHMSHRGITYLRNIYLKGGKDPLNYNPKLPEERDMISAVRRLEPEDVAILALPGVTVQDARYEMAVSEITNQAETSTTINGLRIAVLQAPPNVSPSRAESIAQWVLRSDRIVIVSGHITMAGYRHLGINRVPCDGYYCGVLAMIQPHYSPAAVSVTPGLIGVVTVDTKSVPTTLDAITRAGLEALHYDPGLRQYKFLNGITTSLDPAKRYVCIRRQADQMITDLAGSLQWLRSMPHTQDLRRLVSSSVDAYLRQLLREQRIFGFKPTICDESNNTMRDVAQGRMNIKITYTPVFPADFIRVDLVRDLTSEFSVSTAAGNA
jgi:hypothetical protein